MRNCNGKVHMEGRAPVTIIFQNMQLLPKRAMICAP